MVALILLNLIAAAVVVVEVVVAEIVGGRGNTPPSWMVDSLLKTAILGSVGVVVTQVPLAEMTGIVSRCRQKYRP